MSGAGRALQKWGFFDTHPHTHTHTHTHVTHTHVTHIQMAQQKRGAINFPPFSLSNKHSLTGFRLFPKMTPPSLPPFPPPPLHCSITLCWSIRYATLSLSLSLFLPASRFPLFSRKRFFIGRLLSENICLVCSEMVP